MKSSDLVQLFSGFKSSGPRWSVCALSNHANPLLPWCCGHWSSVITDDDDSVPFSRLNKSCTGCGAFVCNSCDSVVTNVDHCIEHVQKSHVEKDCLVVSTKRKRSREENVEDLSVRIEKAYHASFSIQCLSCGVRVSKDDQCSHVTCVCGCRICYLCGVPLLSSAAEFEHFQGMHDSLEAHNTVKDCDDESTWYCFLWGVAN